MYIICFVHDLGNKRHRKGSPRGRLPNQNKDLRFITLSICCKFRELATLGPCIEEGIEAGKDLRFVGFEASITWEGSVCLKCKNKITNIALLWPVQIDMAYTNVRPRNVK